MLFSVFGTGGVRIAVSGAFHLFPFPLLPASLVDGLEFPSILR